MTSVKVPNSSNVEVEKNAGKCEESRIPVLSPSHFSRTGSLKLRSEIRIPRKSDSSSTSTQPLRRHRSLQGLTSPTLARRFETANYERDDDLDSERSFGSSSNSLCGHSPFAHNGTTYSARNMKYVFHCSPSTASDEYLTPTQRANRTIKRLRRMLADVQAELLEKDNEIGRLTKEIVELRLLKAGCCVDNAGSCVEVDSDFNEPVFNQSAGPRFMDVLLEERDSSNGAERQETNESISQVSDVKSIFPRPFPHSPSLADSGNFEDINSAQLLEKECEKLRQNYDDMREKHNEKVEQLLNIIADSNDRYYELKPKYDSASLRIKELEKEIESVKRASLDRDELQRNFHLQLYAKQSNSKNDVSVVRSSGEQNSSIVEEGKRGERTDEEASDLLRNLLVTRKELENVKVMYRALLDASKLKAGNDAEMTLRFLKTAIYYFLTDTTNSRDHLAAIESILGYSEEEKAKIEKAQGWRY